jgi:hypothetical protein
MQFGIEGQRTKVEADAHISFSSLPGLTRLPLGEAVANYRFFALNGAFMEPR